jgi:8-oxo-dGTP pyrophosphatase MutT (NUDIX family)
MPWEASYLGQLRALAGDDRVLITVGARCVLRDEAGRILLIQRSDDRTWAMPAGTMELGDTLGQTAIREVYEETGLTAHGVTPFGLYTRASDLRPNIFGHSYQHVTMACRVDGWSGELLRATDETVDAGWFAPDALPTGVGANVARTLADLAAFEKTGRFTLE